MHQTEKNNKYAFLKRASTHLGLTILALGISGCKSPVALPGHDSLNTTIQNTPKVVYKAPTAKPSAVPSKAKSKGMLSCQIDSGTVRFGEDWYNFKPTEARVLLGSEGGFTLKRTYGDDIRAMYIRYEPSGQKVVICPTPDDPDFSGEIECTGIYALEEDFEQGIHRTLDVPGAIRGGKIKCNVSK